MANIGKRCGLLAVQLALLSLLAVRASGYYRTDPAEKPFLIKTRVRYWFAATSAQTRMVMETPASWWVPELDNVFIGRTDDFKRMDTSFPLFSAELQPVSGLGLEFEVGDNRYSGGKFQQHGWLHSNNSILYLYNGVVWDRPQHRDYAASTSRLNGTARQYSANLYLRVYKSRLKHLEDDYELNHTVDLFVGYSWYQNRAHITDGYQHLSTDFFLPSPPPGPITGLNSTSRMTWYGWRAGFREQARLSANFSAEGRASFGPRVWFTGEDFLNLQPDLANPSLRHSARGIVLELEGSLSWKFWKQFELEGGYLIWKYSASSGKETSYHTDGSTMEGKLNKVLATRKGFFLALSWKY